MSQFLSDILALVEKAPRCGHEPETVGELTWRQTACAEWHGRHYVERRWGPFAIAASVHGKRKPDRHPKVVIRLSAFGRAIARSI